MHMRDDIRLHTLRAVGVFGLPSLSGALALESRRLSRLASGSAYMDRQLLLIAPRSLYSEQFESTLVMDRSWNAQYQITTRLQLSISNSIWLERDVLPFQDFCSPARHDDLDGTQP